MFVEKYLKTKPLIIYNNYNYFNFFLFFLFRSNIFQLQKLKNLIYNIS